MKIFLFILSFFAVMHLKAQVYFDSLYSQPRLTQYFTDLVIDSIDEKKMLVFSSAFDGAGIDSNSYLKINIYQLQDSNLTLINTIRQNNMNVSLIENTIDASKNVIFAAYYMKDTTYTKIIRSENGFINYTEQFLDVPYKRYFLTKVIKTENGYLISAIKNSIVGSNFFIAELDSNFKRIWLKEYNFSVDTKSILPAKNGYILSGAKQNIFGDSWFWQGKIDTVGNIIWQKTYENDSLYFTSSYESQGVKINGLYYNFGVTKQNIKNTDSNYYYRAFINVIDENGNLVREKYFPKYHNSVFTKIIVFNNYLYIIGDIYTTYYDSINQIGKRGCLYKMDTLLNIEWHQLYNHWERFTKLYNFYKTSTGFTITGTSINKNRFNEFDSMGIYYADGLILKVDMNGCIIENCEPIKYNTIVQDKVKERNTIEVYPNPATNKLNIVFEGNVPQNLTANIYDSKGSLVKSETLINNEIGISNLAQGLYLLTIESEGKGYSSKFVKE
jgi:hypothetical protein